MRTWIGIPYERLADQYGRAGCWNLVRSWYERELGIVLPAYVDPSDRASEALRWCRVEPGMEARGDVVELALPGAPLHVGVVVERGRMLHVHHGGASRVDRYDRPPWARFVRGIWKWRG